MAKMFRSTDASADPAEIQTVSASGVATPYFMLVQMNNAALLEAYETLGIAPSATKIEKQRFPAGFGMAQALAPHEFGAEDQAVHSGNPFGGADPIREVEAETHGTADEMRSFARKVIARFGAMSSDGSDFGDAVTTALERAAGPGTDFDLSVLLTGSAMIGKSAPISTCTADGAGQLPFTGFRADYRPETAPAGLAKTTLRKHSLGARHVLAPGGAAMVLAQAFQEIYRARDRGAGSGDKAPPAGAASLPGSFP